MKFEIPIPKYLAEYFTSLEDEHGIFLDTDQKRWYVMKYKELGEDIRQEYPSTPEEAFMGSSEGYWYLKEINQIIQAGQIGKVPFQPQLAVQTAWDLGFRDKTSIWFYQILPSGNIHVINYYENSGEGLAHYVSYLRSLRFSDRITTNHFPHDAAAHEKGSGLSVEFQAKNLGIDVNVLSRYNPSRSSFMMEIQRARNLLSRCWFDEENCDVGIKCLKGYKKKWNESMVCYTDQPVHDETSHAADAFRYMAQAIETQSHRSNNVKLAEERKKIAAARRRRI